MPLFLPFYAFCVYFDVKQIFTDIQLTSHFTLPNGGRYGIQVIKGEKKRKKHKVLEVLQKKIFFLVF